MSSISQLIERYSQGPMLLRDALGPAANVDSDVDIDARPIAGQWSIREVVCHVADSEIIYADRMKRVLAEENPTFFEADPNLFGPALHSSERTLANELALVAAIRAHMLPILQASSEADFARPGTHSLDGPMTLQTLLERVTGHIPHHVGFIEEKLRRLQS